MAHSCDARPRYIPEILEASHTPYSVARYCTERQLDKTGLIPAFRSTRLELERAITSSNEDLAVSLINQNENPADRKYALTCGLILAATQGSASLVEKLLVLGADPQQADPSGRLAIVCAVESDHVAVIECLLKVSTTEATAKVLSIEGESLLELSQSQAAWDLLIAHGLNVDQKDRLGRTALMRTSSIRVAQYCIKSGCNINTIDNLRRNAFLLSIVSRKSVDLVALLIDAGSDCGAVDEDDRTIFHLFFGSGNTETIDSWTIEEERLVLEQLCKAGVDAKSHDSSGRLPLHHASEYGDAKLVAILLQKAGYTTDNINALSSERSAAVHYTAKDTARSSQSRQTPLSIAARKGHHEIVKVLLEHGADPNVRYLDANTALYDTLRINPSAMNIVKLLLQYEADVNIIDGRGCTALHLISGNTIASLDIIQAIFSRSSDVNVRDENGQTPLHYAAKHGNTVALKFLLESNSVMRMIDDDNENFPIFYAALRPESQYLSLRYFVTSCDWTLSNGSSKSSARYSMCQRRQFQVKEILKNGALCDIIPQCGARDHSDDWIFRWTHILAENPNTLCEVIVVHHLVAKTKTLEHWKQLQHFLSLAEFSSLSGRPRAIIRREKIIRPLDVNELTPQDEVLFILMGMPCFDSCIDKETFELARSRHPSEESVPFNADAVSYKMLWLCLMGDTHLITSFPHDLQSREKGSGNLKLESSAQKVPNAVDDAFKLAMTALRVFTLNEVPINSLFDYVHVCEKRSKSMSRRFEDALSDISDESSESAAGHISSKLFDITSETGLALDLQFVSKTVKSALSVIYSQHSMMESFFAGLFGHGYDVTQFKSIVRNLQDQMRRLEDLQASVKETNESLLVLMDLKHRQANAIEARSAREQSILAKHQNQTLMVFTIVTVVFLPLTFVAAVLTIDIQELPHSSNGQQQMSISFVLRYILGPGLGCAALCVILAFAGTIRRSSRRPLVWIRGALRKQKTSDPEAGLTGDKEKVS